MSIDPRLDPSLLIADDDGQLRSGMAELLGDLGLVIVQAADGGEALEILRSRRVHMALLDMHMPEYSGLDLLQVVRSEVLRIPCIFCSADATEAVLQSALQQGAIAVLRKPVEPTALRAEVRRLMQVALGPRG